MKLKKLVASTLVASMVVSGVATLSTQKEISATTAAPAPVANPDFGSVNLNNEPYPNSVLMANAKAKSAKPGHSSEGNAAYAFDNNNGTMWHTNYDVAGNEVTEGKPSWIQTGFNNVEKLTKVTYLARNGSPNNKILDYELWVSTQDNEPEIATAAADGVDGWKKVHNGTFTDNSEMETITLSAPQDAKWVRLVAKTTKRANNNNHAVATDIKLYTEGVTYNLNTFAQNWDYQIQSNKMSIQEGKRWTFEVQNQQDQWSNITNFADGYWKVTGNSSTNASIGKDGFRNNFSPNKAHAVRWNAVRKGYYTFSQTLNPGSSKRMENNGKIIVTSLNNKGEELTVLKTLTSADSNNVFTTDPQLLDVNGGFRLMAKKDNASGVINYCDFAGGYAPWEVKDVTKDVATQKIDEATTLKNQNTNKPECAKKVLTDAINKLTTANQGNNNDAIVAAIDELATATNQFNNDKLLAYIDTVSKYTFTSATDASVTTAEEAAVAASKTVLADQDAEIAKLRKVVNSATRTYKITLQKSEDGQTTEISNALNPYNTAIGLAAPTVSGKTFQGWYKADETGAPKYLVSNQANATVATSGDATYIAVYGTAPSNVDTSTKLTMQNAFVISDKANAGKFSAVFVGKVDNLQDGKTVSKITLKWNKGTELTNSPISTDAPKVTMNAYNQFSFKVNGIPEKNTITAKLVVTYSDNSTSESSVVTLDI